MTDEAVTSTYDERWALVSLGGVVRDAQSKIGQVIYTLPIAHRPRKNLYLDLRSGAAGEGEPITRVVVETGGSVVLAYARDTVVHLAGPPFRFKPASEERDRGGSPLSRST